MSKKNAITVSDLTGNLTDFFGKSFFSDIKILDIQENALQSPQLTIDQQQSGVIDHFYGGEQFRYLTTVNGQIIRNLSQDRPKIIDNVTFFEKPLLAMAEHFQPNNLTLNFQKHDNFSGEMRVGIRTMAKEISKGDILNPALIFKNSPTGKYKSGISFAFDRVWCSNGARRREVIDFEQINAEILKSPGSIFVNFLEANTEVEYSSFLQMQSTALKSSFLEKDITQEIHKLGFPKKFTEAAHYTIHKECEELGQPLNSYLAYNGFNKILFNRADTSLNIDKKEKLDDDIFQYLLNVSMN